MRIFSKFNNRKLKKCFKKAIKLYREGNYEKSIEICSYLINKDFNIIECYNLLFEIYDVMGDLDKALLHLNNSLKLKPDDIDNIINKGILLYKLDKNDEALEYYNNALLIDDTHDYARVGKLTILIEQEKYNEAKNFYNSIIINTNNSYILDKYATLLYILNILDDALKYSNQSLDINNPKYWNTKGLILEGLKNYNEALKFFNKSINHDPEDIDAIVNKGSIYNNLSEYENALNCFEKALKINPHCVDCWVNKSITYHKLKDYENLELCINKALELDPNDSNNWDKKGLFLDEVGRYDEALLCFDNALKIKPKAINVLINKSNTLLNSNQLNEALNVIDNALDIDGDCQDAALVKVKVLRELGKDSEADILEKEAEDMPEIEDRPLISGKLFY